MLARHLQDGILARTGRVTAALLNPHKFSRKPAETVHEATPGDVRARKAP